MRRRRVAVVLAAGLVLGGGTAVAVGFGVQDGGATPGPAAAPGTAAATSPDPVTSARAVPAPTSAASSAAPSPAEPPRQERAALPEQVRIPAVGVDSDLLHLGLNDDGTIEVPAGDDIDRAAWFDGSPRPGEDGPAVIEGHVDSPNGPSVFFRLAELEPGQEIHVDRRDGSTATFVVDRVEQYPKKQFPTRAVYANTDGAELRVITCGGAWDADWGHYVDNTVVYAHEA
ncbi:class F sortase [Isoptericola sp. b408]|uniref:class F sortase n=1 Tax=Isoptericola sp. b408 TaxID=3064653 RepID=UPI0027123485|nr:class F sortase [Isoptericola sp. b408]MDO8151038.1 class F sortase [Isoptericola sp. b408]